MNQLYFLIHNHCYGQLYLILTFKEEDYSVNQRVWLYVTRMGTISASTIYIILASSKWGSILTHWHQISLLACPCRQHTFLPQSHHHSTANKENLAKQDSVNQWIQNISYSNYTIICYGWLLWTSNIEDIK